MAYPWADRDRIGNRFLQLLTDGNRRAPRAPGRPRAAHGGTLRPSNRQTGGSSHWRKRTVLSGYVMVKRLGVGGLSESIKVVKEQRTSELRVIKRVAERGRPKEELEILKRVPKGLHLNYMVEYAWLPSNTEIALVLEYCDLGDLAHKLEDRVQQNRPFDEGFVWHVLHDVGKGLAYLHGGITDAARQTHSQRGWDMICHLDIKPANIFMSSRGSDGTYPRMVLGDFGCAVTRRDIESGREEPQNHRHGTLDWMPPHSRGDVVGPRNRGYGWHTDVWQLGAVAAAMCRLTHAPILAHVFTDHVAPCGSGYGAKLNAVVRGCVRKNWRRRPKAVEIVRTVLKR